MDVSLLVGVYFDCGGLRLGTALSGFGCMCILDWGSLVIGYFWNGRVLLYLVVFDCC